MLVAELRRWGVPFADLRPCCPRLTPPWVGWPDPETPTVTAIWNTSERPREDWSIRAGRTPGTGSPSPTGDWPMARSPSPKCRPTPTRPGWPVPSWLPRTRQVVRPQPNVRAHAIMLRDAIQLATFWLPDQGAYAIALDGDKRPVDALASNMGHCLWAGIIDPDRVAAVSRWLLSPELFSGWGVRTLATLDGRYDPLSYHNGSVWPHDTAICVAGLRRAGRVDDALRLTAGSSPRVRHRGRNARAVSGISREEAPVPVGYPASCRPQAWASAAPLLILRSLLGLEPDVPSGRIIIDPATGRNNQAMAGLDAPGRRLGQHRRRRRRPRRQGPDFDPGHRQTRRPVCRGAQFHFEAVRVKGGLAGSQRHSELTLYIFTLALPRAFQTPSA